MLIHLVVFQIAQANSRAHSSRSSINPMPAGLFGPLFKNRHSCRAAGGPGTGHDTRLLLTVRDALMGREPGLLIRTFWNPICFLLQSYGLSRRTWVVFRLPTVLGFARQQAANLMFRMPTSHDRLLFDLLEYLAKWNQHINS